MTSDPELFSYERHAALGHPSYGDRLRAEVGERAQVLTDVSLEGEDANHRRGGGHAPRLVLGPDPHGNRVALELLGGSGL